MISAKPFKSIKTFNYSFIALGKRKSVFVLRRYALQGKNLSEAKLDQSVSVCSKFKETKMYDST